MGVLQLLFDLFNSPYMATSLKLLIIKSLDLITHTQCGISYFLKGHADSDGAEYKTGYQQLIDITSIKQVL